MSAAVELLLTAGSVVSSLLAVVAFVWWLIGPRVRVVVRELAGATHQLHPEVAGSTAHNAARAAEAADAIPELQQCVEQLLQAQQAWEELRIAERLERVEHHQDAQDRRIGNVEQLLIETVAGAAGDDTQREDTDT